MTDTSPTKLIDARPIRPSLPSTLWDEAIVRRNVYADLMRSTLADSQVEALVFVSEEGNYPPWVRVEAWMPTETQARSRSELEIVVDVRPYRSAPIVVTARLTRGKRKIEALEWPDFSAEYVADWTLCALTLRELPKSYRPLRDGLRSFFATFLPFIGNPHINPIAAPYRTSYMAQFEVGVALLVLLLGVLACFIAAVVAPGWAAIVVFVAGLVAAVGSALWVRGWLLPKQHAVGVVPQPLIDPRSIGYVDSWHAVIAGIGDEYEAVRDRLVSCLLENESGSGVRCREESYGHRVPNGFEVRSRFVVSMRQAYVYVHLYRFGDDMFVGWQAFLNWEQWGETLPVTHKTERARQTEFRELRRAVYRPSHLDIVQLNALSERVHLKLQRELKRILKEKEIDQEIDFKVLRGDRDSILTQSQGDGGQKPKPRSALRFVGFG